MKKTKKLLSLLLAIAMLFSITAGIDLSAYAETYSGDCGTNAKWSLDINTGVLTISGTGDMDNYSSYYKSAPWYSVRNLISEVKISNGIASIGSSSFLDCNNLIKVTIPSTVVTIGKYSTFDHMEGSVFENCSSLQEITIPSSVKTITSWSFRNCTSLKNVVLQNGTTEIGRYAFENCLIKSITIPDSVIILGEGVFYNCTSLTDAVIGSGVTSVSVKAFGDCSALNSVKIGENVTNINEGAFQYCKNLSNVVLPNGITSIGDGAFRNCESFTEILIPNSVKTIGTGSFYECFLVNSIKLGTGVRSIGDYAFCKCELVKSIVIPASVTSIGNSAFATIKLLNNITIGSNVLTIGEGAFCNCPVLSNVVIPDSVISIGNELFKDCTGLKSVTIGNGINTISEYMFSGCIGLKSIVLPENVMKIKSYAFYKCENLNSLTMSNEVSTIEYGAFGGCSALSDVNYIGTMKEWEAINIDGYNSDITESTIHCADGIINEVVCTIHTYDNGKVTKAATCTANGTKMYTCIVCGETKTETIKATGHTVVTDKAVTATCTKAGKTAGSHCSVCNAVITAQKTVPATGHSYDNGKVTKAATATATGIKTYTCTVCGATKTETIPATGLTAPTLKATVNATGTFTLSWSKVTGATSYELYLQNADGTYKLLKSTAATSLTTAVAAYGKTYTYKIRAVKGSVTSAYSSTVSATNTKKLQTPTLKATVNTTGTFKLSWNAIAGATSYQVYLKNADGTYKLLKTTTATSLTTAVATYGKSYTYKVRAITSKNSSATSAYSSTVTATNTKKLQTPTLKVTVNSTGSFKLSWNKITGATSYKVYLKNANGTYKLLKTTTGTSITTGVAAYGKSYTYKVLAVRGSVTSAYSATVTAKNSKKLQTPSGVKAVTNKNGSFTISWNKVTGATSYQVYVLDSKTNKYKLLKTTTSNKVTTGVAAKGKTYKYKVRALTSKNSSATSAYSSVVSKKR